MANVISLDPYVASEWYAGNTTGTAGVPFYAERPRLFAKEDEGTFWILDFHWPRGQSPMGSVFIEDGDAFAAQEAAEKFALPTTRGMMHRWVGSHIYKSQILVSSPWEVRQREQRFRKSIGSFLESFQTIWREYVEELLEGLRYFEGYNLANAGFPDELLQLLEEARNFHKRAWQIHFEVMYPLAANYVGFRAFCVEHGIPAGDVAKMLQGYDTKFIETDRELWRLARLARELKLGDIFARTSIDGLLSALQKSETGQAWVREFQAFLRGYGWRAEGITDIMLPSWIEDPTPPLGAIRTFLMKPQDFHFEEARLRAASEREEAITNALAKLRDEEDRSRFQALLDQNRKANFSWWNDEHNFYIDLRAWLPVRRICLEIGQRLGAEGRLSRQDDTLFMFYPELVEALKRPDNSDWARIRTLIEARREYYFTWQARRLELPKLLGTVPDEVTDPLFIEIFGLHHAFLESIRREGERVQEIVGLAASAGVVEGTARVILGAEHLDEVLPGEILVCEATSPNWTQAFTKIAGCVCDGGGSLTHAAIISREYRIPCVVGTGIATKRIETGQRIRVDGSKGIVKIY